MSWLHAGSQPAGAYHSRALVLDSKHHIGTEHRVHTSARSTMSVYVVEVAAAASAVWRSDRRFRRRQRQRCTRQCNRRNSNPRQYASAADRRTLAYTR